MFELTFFKASSRYRESFSSLPKIQINNRFFSVKRKFKDIPVDFYPPKLNILENIASSLSYRKNKIPNMSKTGLIGVQHMLPSTAALFDVINNYLKIKKQNMFFSGKFYSTCPEVENYIINNGIHLMPTKSPKRHGIYEENIEENMVNMWEKFVHHLERNKHINKILILDEGGHCVKMMPKYIPYEYEIAVVEQTRFGLYDLDIDSQLFPLIDVARSAAKRRLESPLIASAITSRVTEVVQSLETNKKVVCGIIGNGAIGSAVVGHLLSKGYNVVVYDENNSAFPSIHNRLFYRVDSIKRVISSCDIVFGCTGKDISKENDILSFVKGSITLVNCTSQNTEFLTLLKKATKEDYLIKTIGKNIAQLQYVRERGKEVNFIENGFPINFDRTSKSDPVEDMELTRCLLYCALVQAGLSAKKPVRDGGTVNKGSIQMLDPYLQMLIVKKWIKNQPKNRYSDVEINCFNDVDWIMGNSSGEYKENNFGILWDNFIQDEEKHLAKLKF